jgi:environmental stress-induced protein Ves
MRIIRESEQKRMPWKNGGGETIEIGIAPHNSSLDTFDWRISRARIDRSGPFSPFPGIDRTIAAIEGVGIVLRFENADPVTLTPNDPPFSLAGEVRVESEIIKGTVTDLNVMTRRGRYRHRLMVLADRGPLDVSAGPHQTVAIVAAGSASLRTRAGDIQLSDGDAILLSAADGTARVTSGPGSRLFLIEIRPA